MSHGSGERKGKESGRGRGGGREEEKEAEGGGWKRRGKEGREDERMGMRGRREGTRIGMRGRAGAEEGDGRKRKREELKEKEGRGGRREEEKVCEVGGRAQPLCDTTSLYTRSAESLCSGSANGTKTYLLYLLPRINVPWPHCPGFGSASAALQSVCKCSHHHTHVPRAGGSESVSPGFTIAREKLKRGDAGEPSA